MIDPRTAARLLGGEVSGRRISCPGPGHDRQDRSLSILLDPAAPGGFVVHSFAGDDALACRDHVREVLGLGGDWRDRRQPAAPWRPAVRPAAEAERIRRARWLWAQSRPAAGTVAERYLRSRGITICPPTLRFLPARGEHPPAMIAVFGLPAEPEPGVHAPLAAEAITAVHVTRLRAGGAGKAPDAQGPTKLMLGVTGSAPIALMPPNDLGGLMVAEGIEDALSLHQATGWGAWAAGSAGRLPGLAPLIARLPHIEAVRVAMDDDDSGRRGAGELVRELERLRPDIEVSTVEFGEVRHAAA